VLKSTPWAVLLCKFSDNDTKPHPKDYYVDLFEYLYERPGAPLPVEGYISKYFTWMSHGELSLRGSQVFGWYTLNKARSEYVGSGSNPAGRHDLIQWARQAAIASGIDLSRFWNVIVCLNVPTDLFGGPGGVVCDSDTTQPRWLGQVMGYAYGLEPSRADGSTADYQDPWDIMSVGNAYSAPHSTFGMVGPGLNGANMVALKWFYPGRLWKPSSPSFDVVVELNPLHRYHEAGVTIAQFGPYFAEFRDPDAGEWDTAIPRAAVLIHRFEENRSYLMRATNGERDLVVGSVFQTSDGSNPLVSQTRAEVLEIGRSPNPNSLGFARVRLTHRPAFEEPSLGPAIVFGGVAEGGDGLIIIGGKAIRVPPRSPLYPILEQLAAHESGELLAPGPLRDAVRRQTLEAIMTVSEGELKKMAAFRGPAS
jgi:hypothetical protein